jgi:hypothetical protein
VNECFASLLAVRMVAGIGERLQIVNIECLFLELGAAAAVDLVLRIAVACLRQTWDCSDPKTVHLAAFDEEDCCSVTKRVVADMVDRSFALGNLAKC